MPKLATLTPEQRKIYKELAANPDCWLGSTNTHQPAIICPPGIFLFGAIISNRDKLALIAAGAIVWSKLNDSHLHEFERRKLRLSSNAIRPTHGYLPT